MPPCWLLGILLAGCTPAAEAPSAPRPYDQLAGKALGTSWSVTWSPTPGVASPDVQAAVVAALQDVDAGMSTWRDDSDLSKVRRGPGPVPVRPDTADVVRAALALYDETSGAFDPTVQPLMEFWGLHGTPRTTWPTDDEVAAARRALGADRVAVTWSDGVVSVDAAGTALDLSAIAKGHAVDRVGGALSTLGIPDWFVEVGGEVRTAGRSPRGEAWRVGVEAPVVGGMPGSALVATMALTQGAMATSGNYRSRYEVQGRPVHHTLDPRTGLPTANRMLSATVLAPDCRTADGWATALMVLGPDEGLPLVEARPQLEAWLIVEGEDGQEVRATSGMAAYRVVTSLDDGGSAE